MRLLRSAVDCSQEPALGIKAAERLEPADLGPLEQAGRHSATLRTRLIEMGRHMGLLHSAAHASLREHGAFATWQLHVLDGVPQERAANDFLMALFTHLARRYTGTATPLHEVHFTHQAASDEREYERAFGCRVLLGMPMNALVFPRALLATAMPEANPLLHAAFEAHIDHLLARAAHRTVSEHTRVHLLSNLSRPHSCRVTAVAKVFRMSSATLRRRLDEEGTTLSDLLELVRRENAQSYLSDPDLHFKQVAGMLGYRSYTAFTKAFRRWSNGATPSGYRRAAMCMTAPLSLHR